MKQQLAIMLLLISSLSVGQISGVVRNAETSELVAYVNIYRDDKHWVSADEFGLFSIFAKPGDTLSLSAVGYEPMKIVAKIDGEFLLKPTTYALHDIEVTKPKYEIQYAIGGYTRKDIDMYYSTSGTPQTLGRYFAADPSIRKTPYAKTLVIRTRSKVKNAKFILHILSSDDGKPGQDLIAEQIIGIAKKGNHDTEIDLSRFRIKMPEDGFFVAFEWLIIPENRHEELYQVKDREPFIEVSYSPSFATTRTQTNTSWAIQKKHKWSEFQKVSPERIQKYYDDFKNATGKDAPPFDDRYNEFAMQLMLTN